MQTVFWISALIFWIFSGYEAYHARKWKIQAQRALDNNDALVKSFDDMGKEFNKLVHSYNIFINLVKTNATKEIGENEKQD
ncbi:hypothetical protein [Lactococcus allomyrinae]|uniref:Uncharacterized protein n=1 Tax=Lactococcus allomyrinae TaxID=2419773 RepID=A0A387BT96_9LACT|nr:hypothetical protein [Lactococcus allomyrinae]AYG01691.1 hypothetical protein D7I46_11880 [Lactococcus allomyrinae]